MEKRYIDLIHELSDCETARNFVLARAEAAEAEIGELKTQVRALQLSAEPDFSPDVNALVILLARQTIRAEAAEADARECRAERARYGDMMTARLATVEAERDAARALALRMRDERDEYAAAHEQLPCGHPAAFIAAPAGCDPRCELCAVRAERDALRAQCIEWLPFTEAAETIDSILVWREDAGVFVAFYADEQECWFTSFGEDLTGDLPTFYAKMPKGPTSK